MVEKKQLKEGIVSGLKKGYDLEEVLDAFEVVNDTLALECLVELVNEGKIRFEVS